MIDIDHFGGFIAIAYVTSSFDFVHFPGVEVKLTVWGDKATNNPEQWEGAPVIAFKVN